MSDTASPALSDDELRETLDLLGTVLASVSDRVDAQTGAMDRLVKTATEARIAAFTARDQTDPERYGEIIARTLDCHLGDSFVRLVRVADLLNQQTEQTNGVLERAEEDKWVILNEVRVRERKAERVKRNLPWFGLGALVLALAMTVTLPRFMASNASTCAVLGATWTATTSGVDACVFYQR